MALGPVIGDEQGGQGTKAVSASQMAARFPQARGPHRSSQAACRDQAPQNASEAIAQRRAQAQSGQRAGRSSRSCGAGSEPGGRTSAAVVIASTLVTASETIAAR